jgi:ubiquinone/menaquinone biosynthesis C-methylase UbiE
MKDGAVELPRLNARDGYDRAAAAYTKWRWTEFWRRNEAPLVRAWLAGIAPGLGLDAGAGVGPYANDIVQRHSSIGVDISWSMLNQSHATFKRWLVQGDLALLPLADNAFDWVLSTRALSHIAGLGPVFREFSRVARNGAELLITDVHPAHNYECVSIPTENGDVSIETYKHPLRLFPELLSATNSLQLVKMSEYRLGDLPWMPPKQQFQRIYDFPDSPIFYALHLRKHE